MYDLILRRPTSSASSLLELYSERHLIELDPEHQRIGGIWTREKKQLLIDSLLNGFDVPKLYLQEFMPPLKKGEHVYRYSIIDGKQRLQAIWDFIDGKLPLASDFEYLREDTVNAAGLTYAELSVRYQHLKSRFDATQLDIVLVSTGEPELIEDLFSRLNEAVPLNAPEKRGALGGPLPAKITETSQHRFFKECIPFLDNRYRHRDLAAKFLYIEHMGGVANTKKSDLDKFVTEFKSMQAISPEESRLCISRIVEHVHNTLNLAASIFNERDPMLRQVAMVTLYFHLFRQLQSGAIALSSADIDIREMLIEFERCRKINRRIIEEKGESAGEIDTDLVEFDKHNQTPNDAYAIRIRLEILLKFLAERLGVVKTC